jgi:hypothetical protein
MKNFNLVAKIYMQNIVMAENEEQAKEIFRQQLGLFATHPYEIELVEEIELMEKQKEEQLEATETV